MVGLDSTEIIVILLLIIVPAILITVVPFWKICTKAGFPGALSLLMLIPIANFILPFYIAFSEWPALAKKNDEIK